MLDDIHFMSGKDPDGALGVAGSEWEQTLFNAQIEGEFVQRDILNIVVSGMGGSALAAMLARAWLDEIAIPYEVVRSYEAPRYVGEKTLFVASSYSGNTEETLSALTQAHSQGGWVVVIASGGQLLERAREWKLPYVQLPDGLQPRMAVIYGLRALTKILAEAGAIGYERMEQIEATAEFLKQESETWAPDKPVAHNEAKQLALHGVGKTPVIYGGALTAPLAYKWKISFNENSKNVAFCNQYSEANHNEFIGWTSHPVEKPFAIFDLISHLESPQILKRFELSDKLLSGKRPKSKVVELKGNSSIEQLLWGCILADFVTIYVAILNGVNPVPVELIEKLKSLL